MVVNEKGEKVTVCRRKTNIPLHRVLKTVTLIKTIVFTVLLNNHYGQCSSIVRGVMKEACRVWTGKTLRWCEWEHWPVASIELARKPLGIFALRL